MFKANLSYTMSSRLAWIYKTCLKLPLNPILSPQKKPFLNNDGYENYCCREKSYTTKHVLYTCQEDFTFTYFIFFFSLT